MAGRSIPPAWRPVFALAAVALAALIWLWATPVLEVGHSQPRREKPSERIAGERWLGQVFQADRPGLCRVELALGTFYHRKHDPVRFELIRLPGPPGQDDIDPSVGRTIYSTFFSRSADNGLKIFSFTPQADSKGVWFLARLSAPWTKTGGGLILWTAPRKPGPEGPDGGLMVEGRPVPRTAAFRLLYRSPRTKGRVLAARLDLSGPATPAGAVAALVLVWLALVFGLPWRGPGAGRRSGRLYPVAVIALPLLALAAWLIWSLGTAPRGLEAIYHSRPDANAPPAQTEHYFPAESPGVRIEKRISLMATDADELPKPDSFGVTWRGRLIVPRAGKYVFEVHSGGQTRLSIDGRNLLKMPPFTGRTTSRRVEAELAAGPRDFKLVWLKKGGPTELDIRWGLLGSRLKPLAGPDLLPPGVSPGRADRFCLSLGLVLLWAGTLFGLALLGLRLGQLLREGRGWVMSAGLLLGLTALAVRLVYLFQAKVAWYGPGQDFFHLLRGTDQNVYLLISRGVLKGFYPWLWDQPFTFSPVQAFVLAGIQALAGPDLLIIRLGLHLLGVVTCLLVWDTARRLWGSWAGLWAGLLWALAAPALIYESSLLMAGPLALILMLTAALLVRAFSVAGASAARPDLWLKAGLALGLAGALRGNVLLIAPLIGLTGLFFRRRLVRPFTGLALTALGVALVLVWPMAWNSGLLNSRVGQRTVLVAGHGGRAIWVGNNPRSTGFSRCLETPELRAALTKGETTFQDQVIDFISTRPLAWLDLMWKKTWLFFNGWEPQTVLNLQHIRDHLPLLGRPLAGYTLICALGLAGLILALTGLAGWGPARPPGNDSPNPAGTVALAVMCLGYAASLIIFYVTARYRFPVQPLLAAFGGLALVCLGRGRRWALITAGLIVLCYLAVNWDQLVYPPPEGPAGMWRWWDLTHRIGG